MKYLLGKSTVFFALGLALVAGLVGACSGGSGRPTGGTNTSRAESANSSSNVNVTTTEMEFRFDATPTEAGRITFVVTNQGKIEHNFVLQANGRDYATKMLAPGASDSFTVDLAPGTYAFQCGVIGHNFAGMQGSFTLH